jgi:hypothetical protein
VEKALILQKSEISTVPAGLLEACDAVYMGSDFCVNLLPSVRDIHRTVQRHGRNIVLATPVVTGEGVAKILDLVGKKAAGSRIAEVIVNDWGLLYALRTRGVPVSLGRLLAQQLQRYPQELLAGFCRKYHVRAIEMDDLEFMHNIPENIKVHFHYPLRFLCFTRFCPHEKNICSACRGSCTRKAVSLYAPSVQKDFYLIANAYFELRKAPYDFFGISRIIAPLGFFKDLDRFQRDPRKGDWGGSGREAGA